MKRIWDYLTRTGIDGQTPPHERRYIVFLNAIVVLVLILIAQNLGFCFAYRVPLVQTLVFVKWELDFLSKQGH